MMAGLFMALLVSGILCLVCALFITRRAWRADIEPFNRRSRLFQIALHPERFAMSDHLQAVRCLNGLGFVLILCALGVVAYDVATTVNGNR
jgi:hypothetical protein